MKEVIVTVKDGVAECEMCPPGVRLLIRDYDVDAGDGNGEDESGAEYWENVFGDIPAPDALHQYPPLEWVREHIPKASLAYGLSCPIYGNMVIGVVLSSYTLPIQAKDGAPQWKDRPVEFRILTQLPQENEIPVKLH